MDVTSPSEQFWEPLYHGRDAPDPARRQPNAALVTVLDGLGLTPGRAWDLGCGHGGDALWLASSGWRVTATDVSATAVSRVAAAAKEQGLDDAVDAQQHDLTRTRPAGTFDLVYACYLHNVVEIDRSGALRQAAGQVAPGGYLVLVDHASSAPWSWKQAEPSSFPTPRQTLDELGLHPGEWSTVRCERGERLATGPDGHTTATVVDNLIAVRRAGQ